jgi:hypothetical protein
MKLLKYIIPAVCALFLYVTSVHAQVCNVGTPCGADQVCVGGQCISQPTGMKPEISGQGALPKIISQFFLYTIPVGGLIGFMFFLWSGFEFLTSKGDPKMLQAAKQRLTYTIVGLVILFSAFLITQFVAFLFNIDLNP